MTSFWQSVSPQNTLSTPSLAKCSDNKNLANDLSILFLAKCFYNKNGQTICPSFFWQSVWTTKMDKQFVHPFFGKVFGQKKWTNDLSTLFLAKCFKRKWTNNLSTPFSGNVLKMISTNYLSTTTFSHYMRKIGWTNSLSTWSK